MPPPEKNGYRRLLPGGDKPMTPEYRRRLLTIAVVAFVLGILVIPSLFSSKSVKTLPYSTLLRDARHQGVVNAVINSSTGVITGQLTNGTNYTSNGPVPVITSDTLARLPIIGSRSLRVSPCCSIRNRIASMGSGRSIGSCCAS